MGAEEHDIVARVDRSSGSTSTGALAAHLARACGHVLVDSRVVQQGYRFHAELGEDIPAFFNRRIKVGRNVVSITLQAGIDPEAHAPTPFSGQPVQWAVDPFDGCRTTADARAVLEASDYHASLWTARITVGVDLLDVFAVSAPLFIAKHPAEFRAIAEELVSLGALQAASCPMCADADVD